MQLREQIQELEAQLVSRSPPGLWTASELRDIPRKRKVLERLRRIEGFANQYKQDIVAAAAQDQHSWQRKLRLWDDGGGSFSEADFADEVVDALKQHFDDSVKIEVVRNQRMEVPVRRRGPDAGPKAKHAPKLESEASDFLYAEW